MNDDQLRALVRAAVARHLGRPENCAPGAASDERDLGSHHLGGPAAGGGGRAHAEAGHVSQHIYVTLVNAGDACVIEPSVPCDHCGFCKSHGH